MVVNEQVEAGVGQSEADGAPEAHGAAGHESDFSQGGSSKWDEG
jgi:hypothetical protein